MKTKFEHLSNKEPKIIMLFDQAEEVEGANQILVKHIDDFRAIKSSKETAKFIKNSAPDVLIFALNSIDESIEYYSKLIEEGDISQKHSAILLCKNKESAIAFRSCIQGLFDNYFVYQPLYEKYRLLMIVQNSLRQCESQIIISEFEDDKFDKIDQELNHIIEQSSICKKELLNKIQQGQKQLDTLSEQDDLINSKLPTNELINQISNEHIKPLLSSIEFDIKEQLDSILASLLKNQTNPEAKKALQLPNNAIRSKALTAQATKSKLQKQQEAIMATADPTKNPNLRTKLAIEMAEQEAQKQQQELAQQYHLKPEDIEEPSISNTAKLGKILVVEDNDIYREMIINVLSTEGYQVTGANDGLKALKIIKQERFNIILMDLFMPNLDGLNTTKNIQKLSNGVETPVIALTGNKNKENAKKWISIGLKGYLLKPSSKEEILNVVQEIIQKNNVPQLS